VPTSAPNPYDEVFFSDISTGSRESAQAILPFVQELVQPTSVLDVGCGTGEWLQTWDELGVSDIAGVDGAYVDQSVLAFPAAKFTAVDLATETMALGRRFDLVSSLEVAEHLPEQAARRFVDSLVDHGDVVLFSAAAPGQGGVDHVNEQWPGFWVELFAARGLEVLDVVRPHVWGDVRAVYYYRQNSMIFADRARSPRLFSRCESLPSFDGYSIVHPQLYFTYRRQRGVKELFVDLRAATASAIRRRLS
jgi:SAM-dependent methyltransferase